MAQEQTLAELTYTARIDARTGKTIGISNKRLHKYATLTVELAKDVILLMERGWTEGQISPYLNLAVEDVRRITEAGKPAN